MSKVHKKEIPETMGAVCAVVYLLMIIVFIPFPFYKDIVAATSGGGNRDVVLEMERVQTGRFLHRFPHSKVRTFSNLVRISVYFGQGRSIGLTNFCNYTDSPCRNGNLISFQVEILLQLLWQCIVFIFDFGRSLHVRGVFFCYSLSLSIFDSVSHIQDFEKFYLGTVHLEDFSSMRLGARLGMF